MVEKAPSFDQVLSSGEHQTYVDAVIAHAKMLGTITVGEVAVPQPEEAK